MKKFAVIEIGSTNTKAYLYQNDEVKNIGFETILFKVNYKKENKLAEQDKEKLYEFIKKIGEPNTFVYGTSIFRNLPEEQKKNWLNEFKNRTGFDFHIVDANKENEYTVYGAIRNANYKGKIAVMIGGGGSTELAITEHKEIIEQANSNFGAMDVTEMFPELKTDKASSNYKDMLNAVKKLVTVPKNKADILILAGGDYLYFYDELKYPMEKNKFFNDPLEPSMIETEQMDQLDRKSFYETSLEEVCERTNNDAWWRGTRGMRLCVKALADILEVKYIIPTRINMVYGIVEELKGKCD